VTSVFLCYRSTDGAYAATLLDAKLSEVFGRENVFRASRSVAPGESYASAIMAALEACQTVLVIIGPHWREHLEKSGEDDWVRMEIAAALRQRKEVIPVLLSRTSRLAVTDLPEDISMLAYLQYLKFDHRHAEADLAGILAALKPVARKQVRTEPEFTMRCETGGDGSIELDVVQRRPDGTITGRLSGRAQAHDLARMAAFIATANDLSSPAGASTPED
jgi:hypothetical protein